MLPNNSKFQKQTETSINSAPKPSMKPVSSQPNFVAEKDCEIINLDPVIGGNCSTVNSNGNNNYNHVVQQQQSQQPIVQFQNVTVDGQEAIFIPISTNPAGKF